MILVVVVTRWNRWEGAPGWQETDDAYLQADITPIAAKVPGYVRAVPVQDYQRDAKDQLIAEIVDDDLADIRGAVHAGFDEGAWITTAFTAGQILITPAAVWLGTLHGPRRVLLAAAMVFGSISALTPFATNLETLLAMQFLAGLSSGFLIPLTLGFILTNTPPRFWPIGIAAVPAASLNSTWCAPQDRSPRRARRFRPSRASGVQPCSN